MSEIEHEASLAATLLGRISIWKPELALHLAEHFDAGSVAFRQQLIFSFPAGYFPDAYHHILNRFMEANLLPRRHTHYHIVSKACASIGSEKITGFRNWILSLYDQADVETQTGIISTLTYLSDDLGFQRGYPVTAGARGSNRRRQTYGESSI